MSDDNDSPGFGKFVPGFDFLQNLAKGASQSMPQMPNLSSWVAPTLSVEEVEKRIRDLKAVHFWLDQNAKALTATIQALEVQKMTLATLEGMNVSMTQMADALKLTPEPPNEAAAAKPTGTKTQHNSAAGVVDPLQWWGALTQQFQQIAADAMKDVAAHTAAMGTPTPAAADDANETKAPARKAARKTAAKRRAKKSASH
jgi:hypothetical protein